MVLLLERRTTQRNARQMGPDAVNCQKNISVTQSTGASLINVETLENAFLDRMVIGAIAREVTSRSLRMDFTPNVSQFLSVRRRMETNSVQEMVTRAHAKTIY